MSKPDLSPPATTAGILVAGNWSYRWLAVTLGSLSAFAPLSTDMYLPGFADIAQDLKVELGLVQLTLPAFLIGMAAGQLFWGTLSDHVGRRTPMLVGGAAFILTAMVCVFTQSIWLLVIARLLMGLAGSAGVVVARAVVRDLFDERESARFYSIMMIVGGLAPIIAPSLGAVVLSHWSWRVIFVIVGVFGVLCQLGVLYCVPETLRPEQRSHLRIATVASRYWSLFRERLYMSYTMVMAMVSGVLFLYISSASLLFMDIYGISQAKFSLSFMANASGIYIAGQINRILLRRFSPRQILSVAGTAYLVCCLVLAVVTLQHLAFPLFFAALFLVTASMGFLFPNLVAIAMRPMAEQAGSASALMGMLQFAVGALAGGAVGLLYDHTARPFICLIILLGFSSWILLVFFAQRSSIQPPQPAANGVPS